jgi:hypothetical protein
LTPTIGNLLLASADPDRLHDWYQRAFAISADPDGVPAARRIGVLTDRRTDMAAAAAEPDWVILNVHVADARATAPTSRQDGDSDTDRASGVRAE